MALANQSLAISKAKYAATMQEFEIGARYLEQLEETVEKEREIKNIGPYLLLLCVFPEIVMWLPNRYRGF